MPESGVGSQSADELPEVTGQNPTAPVAPRRLGDAERIPQPYGLRMAPNRLSIVKHFGGNQQTEDAVNAALRWLVRSQSANGGWDASRFGAGFETRALGHDREGAGADAYTAVTGLALLALLGAGHSHLEGKYRQEVYLGLKYLTEVQQADGSLAGDSRLYAQMYCHGIASLALSEAYAMTGDQQLKPFVERSVAYTLSAQNTATGGWRYRPGDQGDMSQFGWQVMALKSAEHAGMPIPTQTRIGMIRFLRSVSTGTYRGLASYRPRSGPSRTMTAEALTCRYFLKLETEPLAIAEAESFIMENVPQVGKPDLYYWYYGTLALFQGQSSNWPTWNEAMQQQLLRWQETDGENAGSWGTDTVWGGYGGRVYTTAMAALCLEVYYRYLPLYQ